MKCSGKRFLSFVGISSLFLLFGKTSYSAQIKVNEETFANLGANLKFFYKYLDKKEKTGSWSQNRFEVQQLRFYINGQISKIVQFYGEFDSNPAKNGEIILNEAGVNLVFTPEIQLRAGQIRIPFERYQMTAIYAEVIPTATGGAILDPQGVFNRPANPYSYSVYSGKPLPRSDRGVTLHGAISQGLIYYNLSIFNEDRTTENKVFYNGWNSASSIKTPKNNKNLEYDVRIEFTPIWLGFKAPALLVPGSDGRVRETELGKYDLLTLGVGYHYEKHLDGLDKGIYGFSSLSRKGWTVDALFEKKFGLWIPNFLVGFIKLNNTHIYNKNGSWEKGDSQVWFIQGQLLYDQKVGLGKPAIGFKWESTKADGEFNGKEDLKLNRLAGVLNYYIKGQAIRVSLEMNYYKYKDAAKEFLKFKNKEDRLTDWYVYIQTMF